MEVHERGGRRLQVLEHHLSPQQLQRSPSAAAAAAGQLPQQPAGGPVRRPLQLSHAAAAAKSAQDVQDAYSTGHPGTSTQLGLQALATEPGQEQQQQQQQQVTKGPPLSLLSRFGPPCEHVATLHDCWQAAVARFPGERALGWRTRDSSGQLLQQYSWMTYAQAGDARSALGTGLLAAGIPAGSALGLYSSNCPHWVLLDGAAHAYSMVSVPLYDSLGPQAVQFIINHAELAVIGCSTAVLPKLSACLQSCPSVRLVVVWDAAAVGTQAPQQQQEQQQQQQSRNTQSSLQHHSSDGSTAADSSCSLRRQQPAVQAQLPPGSDPVLQQLPREWSCKLATLQQLVAAGAARPQPHVPPQPGDTATICYTSGTTGMPKGAVLSHANLVANAAGSAALMAQQSSWGPGDSHLSFLPLAHIFERKNLTLALHFGLAVGFYSGDARRVFDDAAVLQPSLFMAVPRVLNRLHDEVMAEVAQGSALRRRLSQAAYAYKASALAAGDTSGGQLPPLLERLAFGWVKQRLGGRVRYMTTGASPISPAVLTFLRVCITPHAVEGYGMTEAACTISIGRPGDASCGHVGLPLPCCEVVLADVEEMGYSTADSPNPRGEVCVRGPIVFQGYHKQPGETAQVLDAQGWLHTGDIGERLPGGHLRLIDRKKSLFKLAQGEYVAPERLEAVYARSPFVLQVFVHGDSMQQRPVAVVVPEPQALRQWAAEHNIPQHLQDLQELCAEPRAVQAVHESLLQQAAAAGLQGYEAVAGVVLVVQPFSVESGLLTPTQKLRRQAAQQRFAGAIQAVYASLAGGRHREGN